MSTLSTRWSVLQAHDVAGSDLDPDGFLTDDALERWIAEARAAYPCTVELEDPTTGTVLEIDNEIRDELIALEQSARHFN